MVRWFWITGSWDGENVTFSKVVGDLQRSAIKRSQRITFFYVFFMGFPLKVNGWNMKLFSFLGGSLAGLIFQGASYLFVSGTMGFFPLILC